MWNDWIYWLSTLSPDQLLWLLAPLLLLDAPRYGFSALAVWVSDFGNDVFHWVSGRRPAEFAYAPSVAVIVVGHNRADNLQVTLSSIWDSYPKLELVVVDDGSDDEMASVAAAFAEGHPGVTVLRRPRRGGKSSALNFAMAYTQAEVLVYVDSDCELGNNAIWEIVQPLERPEVGAVSGAITGRNTFTNLVTWTQSLEYLRCIFLGRMFTSRLGTLGIVSGAFGAYRRQAIREMAGFDVGPGEDGDLALRLRRSGYEIAFAPYASCRTNVPTRWSQLVRQRRRWEWALVTHECRKHVDLANIFAARFRFSNLVMLLDRWTFNLVLQVFFWAYLAWVCWNAHEHTWKQFFLYYLCYVGIEILQVGITLYYSNQRLRDLATGLAVPLMPFYHLLLRAVASVAILEEIFCRRSFQDDFVPLHVREATRHW